MECKLDIILAPLARDRKYPWKLKVIPGNDSIKRGKRFKLRNLVKRNLTKNNLKKQITKKQKKLSTKKINKNLIGALKWPEKTRRLLKKRRTKSISKMLSKTTKILMKSQKAHQASKTKKNNKKYQKQRFKIKKKRKPKYRLNKNNSKNQLNQKEKRKTTNKTKKTKKRKKYQIAPKGISKWNNLKGLLAHKKKTIPKKASKIQ